MSAAKKRGAGVDLRRPSRTPGKTATEKFVEGKDADKPTRQNLWIPDSLRKTVAVRCAERRETISAFAIRAFRRELEDPSGPLEE